MRWRRLLAWRTLALLALALVAALPLTVFLVSRPPAILACITGAQLLLTLVRPRVGWLALIALAPFGDLLGRVAGWPSGATEPLLLAFLVGWALRQAPGGERPGPHQPSDSSSLGLALCGLLMVAVAASLAVQLVIRQVTTAFPLDFLRYVWTYLWQDYYTNPTPLGVIPGAGFVLEGVALCAVTQLLTRHDAALCRRGAETLAASAAVIATLNLGRLAVLAATGEVPRALGSIVSARVSYVFPDVNAAGSYFALMLWVAGGLAMSSGRRRAARWVAVLTSLLGLLLAGSRSAIAAATLAAALLAIAVGTRTRRAARRFLIPAVAGLTVFAVVYATYSPRSNPLDTEVGVSWRTELAATAYRMVREHPVFGVGPGQFYERSRLFMSPEWRQHHPSENAHNNFLQVVAEMGLVGLAPFLCLLAFVFWRAWRTAGAADTELWQSAIGAGLVAFVATWVTGHPLLIREVALTFWAAVGLVAGADAAREVPARDTGAPLRLVSPVVACALVMLALVPVAADRQLARSDLTRDGRGFSQWHRTPEGIRFRWMFNRAVLYVPASARDVVIPIRSVSGYVTVRVSVQGRQAAQRVVGPERWEEVHVAVPPDSRWASMPVTLQVHGQTPVETAGADYEEHRRLQVALPQVVTAPPTIP